MTPEQFAKRMEEIANDEDFCEYYSHSDADDLMCELLRELGYGEGVDIFEAMPKCYA